METLGVFMAPNRDMDDEFKALSKKTAKRVNPIKIRKLLGLKTLLCMSTTIIKILEYPFLTTTFSE